MLHVGPQIYVVSTDNMLLELAKARLTRASAVDPSQPRKARG